MALLLATAIVMNRYRRRRAAFNQGQSSCPANGCFFGKCSFYEGGANLSHNRFSAGDPGFASDFDFDSAVAGVQTLAAGTALQVHAGGGNDTISGTSGADTLYGDDGNDLIYGNGGDDNIHAGAGDDRVFHYDGDGNDLIEGDAGTDDLVVFGGTQADHLEISASGSRVSVARTNLQTFALDVGTIEIAYTYGAEGDDTITIGNLTGVTGLTYLAVNGGTGNDRLDAGYLPAGVVNGVDFYGDVGNDSIYGHAGADYIAGNEGNDRIYGNGGDDNIHAGAGDDRIFHYRGDGDDYVEGDAGADDLVVFGDTQSDQIEVSVSNQRLVVAQTNLQTFHIDAGTVEYAYTYGAEGDDAITIGDLTGVYGSLTLILNGGSGNDLLDAGDVPAGVVQGVAFYGDTGSDTIYGSGGSDYMLGEDGDDSLQGNGGADNMQGGAGDDTLTWIEGDDSDYIEGGAGFDLVNVTVSEEADQLNVYVSGALLGINRTNLDYFALLIGTSEALDICAQSGNDVVTFGDLTGIADLTRISCSGGNGNDTINASALPGGVIYSITFHGDLGNDTLLGSGGSEYMAGEEGNDLLQGNGGGNNEQGEQGNDTLVASSAGDYVIGAGGRDVVPLPEMFVILRSEMG